MKFFSVIFIFLPCISFAGDFDCASHFYALVESGKRDLLLHSKGYVFDLEVDSDHDGVIRAQLFMRAPVGKVRSEADWPGHGGVGWVEYQENEGILYELPPNEEEPMVRLPAGKLESRIFSACRAHIKSNQLSISKHVAVNGRSYFYKFPTEGKRIKNLFVVSGDKVSVFFSVDNFSFVRYHKRNGGFVDGWLLSSDLKEP